MVAAVSGCALVASIHNCVQLCYVYDGIHIQVYVHVFFLKSEIRHICSGLAYVGFECVFRFSPTRCLVYKDEVITYSVRVCLLLRYKFKNYSE